MLQEEKIFEDQTKFNVVLNFKMQVILQNVAWSLKTKPV